MNGPGAGLKEREEAETFLECVYGFRRTEREKRAAAMLSPEAAFVRKEET
jgi:hypothetical protein